MAKKKSPAKKSAPAKGNKTAGKKSPAKKSSPKKTAPKAEPRKRDEVVIPPPALTGEATGHGAVSEAPVTAPVESAPAVAPAPAETIVEVLSSKPQAVNSKALQSYSSAILSTIRKHFRPHTQKEINDIMQGAKYPFHYSIKSRGNDFPNEIFMELTDGNNTERCPIDPNDFIVING